MSAPRFGVSTHVFHEQRLTRDHLAAIAERGFEAVEVFATRTHFDYHEASACQELAQWLSDTHLTLHSMHAPIVEAMKGGKWVGSFSNASGDEARRRAAIEETRRALDAARITPYSHLVLHLGMPTAENVPAGDNQPAAARRSIEELVEAASDVDVHLALEVIPNDLSTPTALVHLIEEELDGVDIGICLDYGHAHLLGDVIDAVETISGHLLTTHVHDNGGKRDEHLVPFAGGIDWASAIMATQKIGYDGVLMFEVDGAGNPADVLKRAVTARDRLEKLFITL